MRTLLTTVLLCSQLLRVGLAQEAVGSRERKAEPIRVYGIVLSYDTKVVASIDEENITLDVWTPDSAEPFWRLIPRRPPLFHLKSSLPALSLVARFGMPDEKRITLTPNNAKLSSIMPGNRTEPDLAGPLFLGDLVVPLFLGEKEAGQVKLFSKPGAWNTHRALYQVKKKLIAELGSEFVVVDGSPFARSVSLTRETAVPARQESSKGAAGASEGAMH